MFVSVVAIPQVGEEGARRGDRLGDRKAQECAEVDTAGDGRQGQQDMMNGDGRHVDVA